MMRLIWKPLNTFPPGQQSRQMFRLSRRAALALLQGICSRALAFPPTEGVAALLLKIPSCFRGSEEESLIQDSGNPRS